MAIFGLPRTSDARLLDQGEQHYSLTQEFSSYYAIEKTPNEIIELDGEVHTSIFSWDYGLSDRFQLSVEIPYLRNTGGTLDGFINDWHETFDLPEGGRNFVPNNRFMLYYERYGTVVMDHREAKRGLGDISVIASWQGPKDKNRSPWALGFSLNLPTGDKNQFHGNGYTDAALWFKSQERTEFYKMQAGWFYSLGLVYMGGTTFLQEFSRSVAMFGGFGAGIYLTPDVIFIGQMDLHSPIYRGVEVNDLGGYSMQLSLGGYIHLDAGDKVHISVGEDLALDVSPDITFHLGYEWVL